MINELTSLINSNSILTIEENEYFERPDISHKAIYFVGEHESFINLCHIILYLSNEADEAIDLSNLSFVKNNTNKKIILRCAFSENDCWGVNGFVESTKNNIMWYFGEKTASQIASHIHDLGCIWNHLHFDAKSIIITHYLWALKIRNKQLQRQP